MNDRPQVVRTKIPGLLLIKQRSVPTTDGWFIENWHRGKMVVQGLPDFTPVQHNVTRVFARGVTRGLHAEPWDRFISLVGGRSFGAWVDLRQGAGFGKVVTQELTPSVAVFVPRGVANGHQVLENNTIFSYLMEQQWTEEASKQYASVNLFDPELGIQWPLSQAESLVVRRDQLTPKLAHATPLHERQTLLVGADTPLGHALAEEMPSARRVSVDDILAAERSDAGLDLSSFDTMVVAEGPLLRGVPTAPWTHRPWGDAVERAQRLTDVARRHHMRYVFVSQPPAFEGNSTEPDESANISLTSAAGQEAAVGELMAASVPRHLIIRSQWVTGQTTVGLVPDVADAARTGRTVEVPDGMYGRLTFADRLAAGIQHLLDTGSAAGTYNITGDGPASSLKDAVGAMLQLLGGSASSISTVPAPQCVGSNPLAIRRLKETGFRPGNAQLDMQDRLRPPRRMADIPPSPSEGGSEGPFKVLFVCTANICRSAYANVMADAAAIPGVEFKSAGTHGLVGESIDPPLATIAVRNGATPTHEAQQLTKTLVDEADLILTMGNEHRRYILDVWPQAARKAFVIGQAVRHLKEAPAEITFDLVQDHLWKNRSTAPDDEVADPYRLGPEAAEACTTQLDGYIAELKARFTAMHDLERA